MAEGKELLKPREANYEEEDKIYEEKPFEFNPLRREEQYDSPPGGSMIMSFMKNLKIGSDLTSFSAPISFNNGYSALEMQGDSLRPSEPLEAFLKEGDAAKRMLHLLNHVIRAMSGFISFRLDGSKPFNPILGEQYFAKWDMQDGSLCELVSEQVSHHPPIASYRIENKENNFISEGSFGANVVFKGNSVDLCHKGFRRICQVNPVTKENEEYLSTGPAAVCKGIFLGNLKFGCSGKLVITCAKTNTLGVVNFNVHTLKLKVKQKKSPSSKTHDIKVYRGEGSMLNSFKVKNLLTKEEFDFYNLSTNKNYMKRKKPLSVMNPLESRRVWHNVAYAMKTNDKETAMTEKNILEENQRHLRRERENTKKTWAPAFFDHQGDTAPNGETPYYTMNETGLSYFSKVNDEDLDVDDLD